MRPILHSRFGLAMLALCLALLPTARAQQTLYAAAYGSSGDTLYTVNPANGQTITEIGALADAGANPYNVYTMSFQPGTGTLFGIGYGSGAESLITIDTNTAVVTSIAPLSTYAAVAFDPGSGALFGVDEHGNLATIDPTTGSIVEVGYSGFAGQDSGGFAINALGQYFTVPYYTTGPLVTLDPASGAGTLAANLSGWSLAYGYFYSLAFDSNDTLYGILTDYSSSPGNFYLATIDPTTGQIATLGSTIGNDAFAFSPSATPSAPLVATVEASAVTSAAATLNGLVNPEGNATGVTISWGATPAFGNTNVIANLTAGFTPQSVSLPLTGLTPGATIYYSVTASNVLGSVPGSVLSVTTLIPGAQQLYFANGGELDILNAANGRVIADIGPLMDTGANPQELAALCFRPGTGTLYGFTDDGYLATVNTNTAVVTIIGLLNFDLSGIAFDPASGTLYGADYYGNLCTIDPLTAEVTELGYSGLNDTDSGGFAINSIGQYFIVPYEANGPLATFNPVNGVATVVTTLSGAPFSNGYLLDLAFDANDKLYAINVNSYDNAYQYVSIDTTSGQVTVLGGAVSDGGLAFSLSALPSAPLVATLAAGLVTTNTAMVNGLANPKGSATSVAVLWGTTTNFGNTTLLTGLPAGSVPKTVGTTLTGLLPGTEYYFMVVATNGNGAGSGGVLNFTTLVPGAQMLYAVAGSELVTLNPANGQMASDIGSLVDTNGTLYQPYDLVFQPATGTLYGLVYDTYYAYRDLVTIDTNTAVVTFAATIDKQMAGIAFDPGSGGLFGVDQYENFYTIDPATFQATEVGASGLTAYIGAFAINSLGQYFSIPEDAGGQLATYNPATGAGTVASYLSGAPFSNGYIYNAAFDAKDTLYALNESESDTSFDLITINPNTGQITDLGPAAANNALAFAPSSAPAAPLVLTRAASFVVATSATINGVVNPNGDDTTVSFLWGTTTNFGNTNMVADLAAGFAPESLASALNGLLPGTGYYFTIAVVNTAGAAQGSVRHFTTQPTPAAGFDQLLYSADGGTNADAQLYVLDPGTGETVSDIGPLVDAAGNHYAMTGLRFQPDTGVLYGITSTNSPSYPAALVTIDPATATVTEIGYLNTSYDPGLGDLAFDPASGSLYGPGAVSGDLYAINLATGGASLINFSGLPVGAGIGFAINGLGQYFTTPNGANGALATYNPANGVGSIVASLSGAPLDNAIDALAFSQKGVLYGLNNDSAADAADLVTINTATGQIIEVGSTISDAGGLAFSLPVSSPSVTTLTAAAVTSNSATVNGLVTPNGLGTSVSILWGTTTNFGHTNLLAALSAAFAPQNVSAALSGLSPLTVYYFTVSGGNALGTNSGVVRSFITPPPGFQQSLYATGGGELYTLNPTNGQLVSDVGTLADTNGNPAQVYGLRFQPSTGTLYGTMYLPSDAEYLVTINPATAVVTEVGPFGSPSLVDIAFDPSSGALYGMDFNGSLCTVNITTGQATEIGSSGFGYADSGGFAINSLGNYLTVPNYADGPLATLNPATGAGTVIATLSGALTVNASVYNLAFDANDTLYGLLTDYDGDSDHLVTINPGSGKVTDLGTTPATFGLAFSPPSPLLPYATVLAASGVTGSSATLNGTVNPNGLAASVAILWGTTTNFGNTNILAGLAAGIAPQPVSSALTGLSPLTTYYFTVTATNALGSGNGQILSFTTPGAPNVATTPTTGVTSTSATLNGTVNPDGLATTVYFIWGPGSASGNTNLVATLPAGRTAMPVEDSLTGLAPHTAYDYQIMAVNAQGTTFGAQYSLVTPGAPETEDLSVSAITTNSAELSGLVTARGASCGAWFEWGTTTSYGQTTPVTNIGGGWPYIAVSNLITGLSPATTYHFRLVATNSVGNTNSADYSFSTPSAPTAVTHSATAVTSTSATLNASVNPNGLPTTVYFIWGPGSSMSNTNLAGDLAAGSAAVNVSCPITALAPHTAYGFQVMAVNALGTILGSQLTLTTPGAPEVTGVSAGRITSTSAVLNGSVNARGASCGAWFAWGTATNYGQTTPVTSIGNGWPYIAVNNPLTGLIPGTTYHFRMFATNSVGNTTSADFSFNTVGPPTTITHSATSITASSATLNGTVNPNGLATTVYFVWGPGGASGNTNLAANLPAGTTPVNVTTSLTGLAPHTGYACQVMAVNAAGTNFGAQSSFATIGSPEMENVTVSAISPNSAVLNGLVTARGAACGAWFVWGTTTNYGQTTAVTNIGNGWPYVAANDPITGLTPGTTYHFQLLATNSAGNTNSADYSFTTPAAPVAVTHSPTGVTSTTATLNGTVNPNRLATAVYFIWGPGGASGNTNLAVSLPAGTATVSVSNVLAGLAPHTGYEFQVMAVNTAGTNFGAVLSFATTGSPEIENVSASAVTTDSARLNGLVTARGASCGAWFAWGTTTNYGQTTAVTNIGGGWPYLAVSNLITGLNPGTQYHFRLFATNSVGSTNSADYTFTTAPTPDLTQRDNAKPVAMPVQILGVSTLADGTKRIEMAAKPGQTYIIEAAGNPAAAVWSVISTNTADANGKFSFVDPESADAPSRYYRLGRP